MITTEASSWRFVPSKGDERKGAQVDLVIKRADKLIHLVEMKFSETRYTVTKAYQEKLIERKALFMDATSISNGVVITFVTPMGLSQGIHSSVVHSELTTDDLFAEVGKYE